MFREPHHPCAERGFCLDTETFSTLTEVLEGFILGARLAAVLSLEDVGVKEGIPGGIREQQAPSDSIGEVVF